MARAIWSGSIGFGLVSIPVRLYGATKKRDVRFHELQEGTGRRIRHRRVAEETGQEVEYENVVKGYEVEKGEYVVVTPEELETARPEVTHTIEILDFVDLSEIDPIYFEKSYYVGPKEDVGAERPYALLLRAMQDRGKVGVGSFVMREKEHLAAIRPMTGVLVLETMFFPDEVRGANEVENLPSDVEIDRKQLDMAVQLIDSLATSWNPERYRDTYRERVLELIERKAEGRDVATEEPKTEPRVRDLMEALRASVEAAKQGREPARRSGAKKAAARSRTKRPAEDLETLSREELYERAQSLGIPGRSSMSKMELVRALKRAS
jgi:DNA end-binding protein Ku